MNAKMADLRRCFEQAGFVDVKTVLSSGNVVFSGAPSSINSLERKAEAAMQAELGRSFSTMVRSVDFLQAMIERNVYAGFQLASNAKRVVTFLRKPIAGKLALPISLQDAQILAADATEVYTAYVPQPNDPVFMRLIEKTFGKEVTTRTWETIGKCVKA